MLPILPDTAAISRKLKNACRELSGARPTCLLFKAEFFPEHKAGADAGDPGKRQGSDRYIERPMRMVKACQPYTGKDQQGARYKLGP